MATPTGRTAKLIAGRKERCHPDCPGFVPGDRGMERCDECASLNGYAGRVSDRDVARLPAARKLARQVYTEGK